MIFTEFQTVNFKSGEVIFKEGEQHDSAYVVISGSVSVSKKKGNEIINLAVL